MYAKLLILHETNEVVTVLKNERWFYNDMQALSFSIITN